MKKKRTIMLFLQLALLIGCVFTFYSYVQKEVQPTKVYQYVNTLDVNDAVKVMVTEIPAKAVKDGMLLVNDKNKQKDIESKVANTKVFKGHYVYNEQLSKPSEIDVFKTIDLSKYRKISLPITYVEGFGGDVKRGDKVDLVFTGQGEKEDDGTGLAKEFQYSKTFLQDVLVYSVTTDTGYRFDDHSAKAEGEVEEGGENISTSGSAEDLAVITVAVTLDQVEEIQTRKAVGTISFASRFEENQSYETLGFVVGDYEKIFSGTANAETDRAVISGK